MKTKRNWTAAGLALTVLALLVLPRPVLAKDHQLRIKGEETGAVFPGAFQFPFHFESLAATGKASHLGHYTLTGNFAVDVRVGMSTGVFTLSTHDGDELFLTEAGHGVAIGDFIHKVWQAVGDFIRRRTIPRRRAPDGRGDVGAVEGEPVVA